MNKLILCSMLAVGLCYGEVDYNKVMEHLGGNCEFKQKMSSEYKKIFSCDNGFIQFDFDNYEIVMRVDTLVNGQKYKMAFLFNRAWSKNGNQIHKDKSTIAIVEDEFGTVVNTASGKWSSRCGDFYKRFKEDVYYGKQETVEHKKNDSTIETILTNRTDCPPSWQVRGRCLKSYFDYNPDGGWYCDNNDCK